MCTMVIKIGGGRGIDPTACTPEIAELVAEGTRIVIVHGGSHATSQLAEALGHSPRTIISPGGHQSRRTDPRTLEIFKMACCGQVNKAVVQSLRAAGVNAIGLSGIDGGIWIGSRKTAIRAIEGGRTFIIRDDLSGRVGSVDTYLLNTLLDSGRTPVLTPPAVTPDGIAINVDADRAAAATAAALGAEELLLLSNVPGLLRDPEDPGSLIDRIDTHEEQSIETARASARGRMKNKLLAAEEALAGGVSSVVIGSAHGERAIERACRGEGSVFVSQQSTSP